MSPFIAELQVGGFDAQIASDGDLKLPKRFVVDPPAIRDTMSEWLRKSGVSNIAATAAKLIGFEKHEAWDAILLEVR